VSVKIEKRDGIAVLRMDKARANAIDETFVGDMTDAVGRVEEDGDVRGVLLASAHPRVFCPGLDLVGLVELDRAAMKAFMDRFELMVWALYGMSKPVVAAIGGHAVAGGCVLALTADYRVLKRGVNIGLNEVRVGVPLPWTVATLLRASVRPERLTEVALLGKNFADQEALDAGLAQEIAEDAEARGLERMGEFLEKDSRSLARTKQYLRAHALADMKSHGAEHADEWLGSWFAESTRARIKEMVSALGKPK